MLLLNGKRFPAATQLKWRSCDLRAGAVRRLKILLSNLKIMFAASMREMDF